MRVLGKAKLSAFMRLRAQSEGPLKAWLKEAEAAAWTKWADIKARYPGADLIQSGKKGTDAGGGKGHIVVFNIKGNDFRLGVKVYFTRSMILIERIGTHAEYNRWKF